MKITTRLTLLAAIASVAGFASTSIASAQVIGIDFNIGGAANESPGSSAVVGPYASAGWYNNFNLSTPTSISLVDNTDTATGATLGMTNYPQNTLQGNAIYSPGFGNFGTPNASLTPNQQLYNGQSGTFAFGNSAGQEVVLNNIPYAQYDLYVLVDSLNIGTAITEVQNFDGAVAGGAGTPVYLTFSPGGQYGVATVSSFPGFVQATGTTPGGATSGADYVLFSGLTSSSEAIDIEDWTAHNGGAPYDSGASIGGIEIVDTAPGAGAVPEPSTYAMLLGGLGMLILIARRRLVS